VGLRLSEPLIRGMIARGAENATKFTGGNRPGMAELLSAPLCAGSAADTIPREREEARAFL